MTYAQFYAARLLIAEERYGKPLRASQRALDDKAEATKAAIRQSMPRKQVVNGNTPAVIPPRPITDEIVGA